MSKIQPKSNFFFWRNNNCFVIDQIIDIWFHVYSDQDKYQEEFDTNKKAYNRYPTARQWTGVDLQLHWPMMFEFEQVLCQWENVVNNERLAIPSGTQTRTTILESTNDCYGKELFPGLIVIDRWLINPLMLSYDPL